MLQQSRSLERTCDFIGREAAQADETRIVQDMLELFHSFEKTFRRLCVHFFGYDVAAAEGREVRLHPYPFFRRLREIEIAGMIQERSLVEMTLVAAREKTHVSVIQLGNILLTNEPILFRYDAVLRQYPDSLAPCGMYPFVLGRGHGKQFRKFDSEYDRNVGVFRDDAPVLYRQQREFTLHGSGF